MENRKKITLIVFLVAISAVVMTGAVMENTVADFPPQFVASQPVGYTELDAYSTNPSKIKAIVKGSIYETGENMTVFGACFDGDGYLLQDANATFTAWYPNGTIFVGETPMIPILGNVSDPNTTSGRFRIHVTMSDTLGTYLTQFNCSIDAPGPNDDYAIAFGEWQNPEWVKRIGDTQQSVLNISDIVNLNQEQLSNITQNLYNFSSDVQDNFSTVINKIDALEAGDDRQINELRELVHSIQTSFWVVDATNPTYSLSSGSHNYVAVDMAGSANVHAVSSDGYAVYWDGETWTERNLSTVTFSGVSAIPAALAYAWYVGSEGGSPVYSINGGATQSVGGATGTTFTDVEVFMQPNNPEGENYVYLMTDTGEIWFSNDTGDSWSNVATMGDTDLYGRMSQVVDNVVDSQVTEGYRIMFGMGESVVFYDGSDYSTTFTLSGQQVRDVGLLYQDKGWVVTEDGAGELRVYEFDGTSLTLQYMTNGTSTLLGEGLGVVAQNDLWIATADPSVFYHYNGRTWEYARFPFSEFVGVVVGFGTNLTATGLHDITMLNGKVGYAVGDDGLVMKFQNHQDERFDEILNEVQVNGGNITELTNIVVDMNNSIQGNLSEVLSKLDQLNASLTVKLDQVLANLTIIDVVVDDIYTNTVTILAQLGIIQGQLNTTIELQNSTLNIVNQTQQDVETLLNRSGRPRAWITQ